MWDVVVVGGGPAGAAAALGALRARPGARVLVLDRAAFPRDKVCGDGVAPHAVALLRELGVADPVGAAPPVTGLTVEVEGGPRAVGTLRRDAYVVRRVDFDARLLAAAVAAGAEVAQHRVRELDRGDDAVLIDGRWRARVAVGADGASSEVRRLLRVPGPRRTAVALRGYAPCSSHGQLVRLARHGPQPAYAWEFPLGDGFANVGYGELVRPGAKPSRVHLLTRLRALLPAVGDLDEPRAHLLPLSTGRPRLPDGRVLLVGDAAGLVNPLSGEGIYYAVLSGSIAGAADVAAGDPGRAYRRALDAALARHFRHTALLAAGATRPALLRAAVAGAARSFAAFDDLVELSLGDGRVTPALLRALGNGLVHP